MIPNAITNDGPYADFWRHLKSIDHVLERILDPNIAEKKLTELDRDRLNALIAFLQGGLPVETQPQNLSADLLRHALSTKPEYSSAINLRSKISEIQEFNNWPKLAKKGYEAKIHRLIQATQEYLTTSLTTLFPSPTEELAILHAVIHSLVRNTEAAMQY